MTTIEIDASKITWGKFRRLATSFSVPEFHALLKVCSNLKTDEELDVLTLPEMRQVIADLNEAMSEAFVPKAKSSS